LPLPHADEVRQLDECPLRADLDVLQDAIEVAGRDVLAGHRFDEARIRHRVTHAWRQRHAELDGGQPERLPEGSNSLIAGRATHGVLRIPFVVALVVLYADLPPLVAQRIEMDRAKLADGKIPERVEQTAVHGVLGCGPCSVLVPPWGS
jgi:hypothetical protein